jgi:hypothetical protein
MLLQVCQRIGVGRRRGREVAQCFTKGMRSQAALKTVNVQLIGD